MPTDNTDNSLVSRYIRAIENPDSVGFRNGNWYQSNRKGDDPNNRGFGVDIKHNKKATFKTKNRKDKHLTEKEERSIRNDFINYIDDILDSNTPPVRNYPSEAKRAMAMGILYRGDGIKTIIKNPSLSNAYLYGSDEDFKNAVTEYYKSKGLNEKARLHESFMDKQEAEDNPKVDWFKPVISFPMHRKDNGGFMPLMDLANHTFDDGGIKSSNGQYSVRPENYNAVLDSVSKNLPLEVELPTVIIKPEAWQKDFHDNFGTPEIRKEIIRHLDKYTDKSLKEAYDEEQKKAKYAKNKALTDFAYNTFAWRNKL